MIQVGSLVRLTLPFSITFPGTYTVVSFNAVNSSWTIEGIGDFDPQFLELA